MEFFDLYRLEIKLCLIIKTLGVTGACPRSAFRQPPPTYRSFSHRPFNHSGICTIGRYNRCRVRQNPQRGF